MSAPPAVAAGRDAAALAAIKARLIAQWDWRRPPAAPAEAAEAWLQSELPEQPPLGGLAVGHSRDPATGEPRIELRASAGGGPHRARVLQAQRTAELQWGLPPILRLFAAKPSIPLHKPRAEPAPPLLGGKRRPLHLGASVAHEQGGAGSLGAFVQIEGGGRGILSCTHVLAWAYRGRVRKRDPIQQPGRPDVVSGANRIGELTEHFAPFVSSKADNLDAAVARLEDDVPCLGNVVPDAACIPAAFRGRPVGAPLDREEVTTGMQVVKLGRTTGFTRGIVSAVEFENFRPNLGSIGPFTFGSVHEIAWLDGEPAFTQPGDSGALVMTEAGLRPIGIHFCAVPLEDGGWVSYIVPWWRIRDTFPIRLGCG